MKIIGNLLWIFLGGGIIFFFLYLLGGIMLCITIIGIPFGIQKFKLAIFALAPFGSEIEENQNASGCLYILLNIIWIISWGIGIALLHVVLAFISAITIIGLPFARQHLKMARLALAPFGRDFS